MFTHRPYMQYKHQFETAARALGSNHKIDINFSMGACILTLDNGREIWLEPGPDYESMLIHTEIKDRMSHQRRVEFWQKCLELNTLTDALDGAWLGFHTDTDTLRLCTIVHGDQVSEQSLEDALKRMVNACRKIVRMVENASLAMPNLPSNLQPENTVRRPRI